MMDPVSRGNHMAKHPGCFVWTHSSFEAHHDDLDLTYGFYRFREERGREEHQDQQDAAADAEAAENDANLGPAGAGRRFPKWRLRTIRTWLGVGTTHVCLAHPRPAEHGALVHPGENIPNPHDTSVSQHYESRTDEDASPQRDSTAAGGEPEGGHYVGELHEARQHPEGVIQEMAGDVPLLVQPGERESTPEQARPEK